MAERCEICDWPLAESAKLGCVPGNCCYRPDPESAEGRRVADRRRQLRAAVDDLRGVRIERLGVAAGGPGGG